MVSEINEAVRNTDYRASKMYILCAVLCAMLSALVVNLGRFPCSKSGKMNEHVI
jgi:hypothetical protein